MSIAKKKAKKADNSRERLYANHKRITEKAHKIMVLKNHDYSAWKLQDAYANFRAFGRVGILVRLSDKMARLRTFVEKLEGNEDGFKVQDESFEDTIVDAINYLVILASYEPEPQVA